MVWTSYLWPLTPLTVACLMKLLVIPSFMLPAQAISVESPAQTGISVAASPLENPLTEPVQGERIASESRLSQTQWNGFEPPRRGIPGRREAGGTRGGCTAPISSTKSRRMTALIPASNLGRTASEKLTFFYYIPFRLENTPVEFELIDEEDNIVYSQSFTFSNAQPGIVQLNFSEQENLPKLVTNKNYRWYLTIKCNIDDPSANLVLYGWVQRVKLTTSQKIKISQADPQEQLRFYAEKGLWYETLAVLAQLRLSNPTDVSLKTEWLELLDAVGLASLADQPFVPSQFEVNAELDVTQSSY